MLKASSANQRLISTAVMISIVSLVGFVLCLIFQWPSQFVLGEVADSRVTLSDIVSGTALYNIAQQYYFQELIMYFDLLTVLLFALIWICIVTFLWLKKKKSLIYLIFFTIFYIYIVKVLDYTLFQFQSLILLKYFMPDLILNGQTVGKDMNLIPLITLTPQDLKTSLLNIMLLIPFGFGLPFITNLRMKKIVVIGAFFSIVIEFLQLITGFMAKITFRIADINDVIFNIVGVTIGYILFVGFVRIYRPISHHREVSVNPILRYIAERPQIDEEQLTG